jgi:hypothetical protein
MEEYISHQDYKKMLGNFGKQTPKRALNEMHTMEKDDGPNEFHKLPADFDEGLEKEGNAFTAGLAKTKKGGEFEVGGKKFKDRTNYDSNLEEYQFDQMYPDDPGPFENKDVDDMIEEFLVREDDVNWDRMDDEEAEENETDNGIEEDINLPSSQPTGPSIEETRRPLSHLSPEERDQLRQYVETIKTVKEEINKMINKSGMKEGGNMTNLIMRPNTGNIRK